MSRFVTDDTLRIDLIDGDWVIVRKELGYGDRVSIQEKLMSDLSPEQMMEIDRIAEQENKAKAEGVDNGPKGPSAAADLLKDVRLNHRGANIETLVRAIVDWGGPGFMIDGHKAEVTPEAIAKLGGTAELILARLKKEMVTKTEGFTKPLSQPTDMAAQADPQRDASTTLKSSSVPVGLGHSSKKRRNQ